MKPDIHPQYNDLTVSCVCGHVILTGSIMPTLKVEICSACHPFYTGQQKLIDTEGRVERFKKRYAKA
jgi:large subunit ribosomal protein L31